MTTFREVVQRGKLWGPLRDDVEPVRLLANIMALCFFTFSNAYTISARLELGPEWPAPLGRLESIRLMVGQAIGRAPGAAVRLPVRPRCRASR